MAAAAPGPSVQAISIRFAGDHFYVGSARWIIGLHFGKASEKRFGKQSRARSTTGISADSFPKSRSGPNTRIEHTHLQADRCNNALTTEGLFASVLLYRKPAVTARSTR